MKEKVVKKKEILQYITKESIVELAKNFIKIPSPTGEENITGNKIDNQTVRSPGENIRALFGRK